MNKYTSDSEFYFPMARDDHIGDNITLGQVLDAADGLFDVEAILTFGTKSFANRTIIGRPKFPIEFVYDWRTPNATDILIREITNAYCRLKAVNIERDGCVSPARLAFDIDAQATANDLRDDFLKMKNDGIMYVELGKQSGMAFLFPHADFVEPDYGEKSITLLLDGYLDSNRKCREKKPWCDPMALRHINID